MKKRGRFGAIICQVERHGAVLLRGFEGTCTPAGIHQLYTSLGLKPCEDPLSKTGLRKSIDNQVSGIPLPEAYKSNRYV